MKDPEYWATGTGQGTACSICGCIVDERMRDKHNSFHASLALLLGIEGD